MRSLYLRLSLFLSAICAPAMLSADSPFPTARIINGSPVSPSSSSVVEVTRTSSSGTWICSGSVITANTILTASHCVSRQPRVMGVVIDGRRFAVRKVRVHPEARFSPTNGLLYNDVALLFLSRPTSKPRLNVLLSQKPRHNDLLTIAGYGRDESGRTEVLRQGVTPVERSGRNFIISYFTSLKVSNTCNGDSGGPAIYSYTDSSGVRHTGIVGITSSGTKTSCYLGDRSYYANVQSAKISPFLLRNVRRIRID